MAGGTVHRKRTSPELTFGVVALVAAAVLAVLLYFWQGWQPYFVWLVGCNLTTFLFFRYDKRKAAQPGATRIPEIILLGLMLAGGFLGGWLGMVLRPRHKTHKPLFWVVLVASTLLHLWLIVYLLF